MEEKEYSQLELNNFKKNQYKDILEFFKSISIQERWKFIIELIIDLKFIDYDESEPCYI